MDICLDRILKLLAENNVKNNELTTHLGIPKSAVSDWKAGKVQSYRKYIAEISDFFDVSADYLLGRTDMRKGGDWDDLIKQYQLCDTSKQEVVNRLIGLRLEKGFPKAVPLKDEEDMSAVIELFNIFDQLNILSKTKVLSLAIGESNKNR